MKSKKLFGKLNIIDIIIILVIIIAAVFFAIRYLNIGNNVGLETVDINFTVVVESMPEELYTQVVSTLPATMISGKETVPGTILSASSEHCNVESIKSSYPYGTDVELTHIPDEDQKFVTATFDCTATINAASINNEFGAQELRIGRVHYLKSRDIELIGLITSMTKSDTP